MSLRVGFGDTTPCIRQVQLSDCAEPARQSGPFKLFGKPVYRRGQHSQMDYIVSKLPRFKPVPRRFNAC